MTMIVEGSKKPNVLPKASFRAGLYPALNGAFVISGSSNGRTWGFESHYRGSSPRPEAILRRIHENHSNNNILFRNPVHYAVFLLFTFNNPHWTIRRWPSVSNQSFINWYNFNDNGHWPVIIFKVITNGDWEQLPKGPSPWVWITPNRRQFQKRVLTSFIPCKQWNSEGCSKTERVREFLTARYAFLPLDRDTVVE